MPHQNGQVPSISLATRLEINALVDELMSDGETFSAGSGKRLIQIVPITPPPSRYQAKVNWTQEGGVAQGAAAGGGTASAATNDQQKSFSVGSDGTFLIGGSKISHRPGRIDIKKMWHNEFSGDSICRLADDPGSREPQALLLSSDRAVVVGMFRLVFGQRFDIWKRPEAC